MTDRLFLERMIALTDKLGRAAAARPYDPDAYNAVLADIRSESARQAGSRRRIPWFAFYLICFLLVVLGWIIYEILDALIF